MSLSLLKTALELGLISSITVLALFLSYSMLNVCDLSTDGCFTLGASVGAVVALAGYPYLSIIAAMCAGVLSGFITAILQTKMGVDSLLAGIVVNTGLYSVNIAIMGGASLLNMNKTDTVFTKLEHVLSGGAAEEYSRLIVIVIAVALVCVFQHFFLRTRIGLAIRATGNNPDMVRSFLEKGFEHEREGVDGNEGDEDTAGDNRDVKQGHPLCDKEHKEESESAYPAGHNGLFPAEFLAELTCGNCADNGRRRKEGNDERCV